MRVRANERHYHRRLSAYTLACALPSGCGPVAVEQVPEGCFPPNPREEQWQEWIDYVEAPGGKDIYELTRHQNATGFCEDGRGQYSPPLDKYKSREVHIGVVCLDAPDEGACEACPEEDVEAEIRDAYADLQERRMCPEDPAAREIQEFELGCVARVQIEGQWQCCYNAAIVGACEINPGHD